MRLLSGLLLIVLLLVGCGSDERTMQLIGEAESVMIEHPDSALNIMRSIDPETIRGEEDMSRYRLVMAEACYYNRIVPSRDSIAEPLFEYYLDSDDHAMRARALYQYALVMSYHGENSYAMKALIEARKSLQHVSNMRLEGLVHRSIGDIYNNECLYKNALESFGLAKNCFTKADLPLHSLHSSFMVASTHLSLRNYVQGIEVFKECENEALSLGDNRMVYDAQVRLCYAYIEIGDYDSFVNTYERMSAQVSCLGGDYYCFGAFYQAYQGNYLEAEKLYDQALCFANESPLYLNYIRLQLYVMKGDYKSALMQYLCNVAASDSDVMKALDHNVLNTQVDALENEIAYKEQLNRHLKLLYMCSVVVVVLVILLILFYVYYLRKKHKLKESAYIGVISELEVMRRESEMSQEMYDAIDRLYRQQFNEINRLCELYYEFQDSPKRVSMIVSDVAKKIDALREDDDKLQELEDTINLFNDGAMQKIRALNLQLTEREQRIILYSFAGLSNRAICMLVKCNSETLPKIKYTIREKIKRSDSDDISQLLSYLSNKKR